MTDAPAAIHLADYQPFTHLVNGVELTFRLAPQATRVLARIRFAPNPARPGVHPLRLDGEGLRLLACTVDGQPVQAALDAKGMTISAADLPPDGFLLETEVEIAPADNTALEGLYMSKGMYCTQCEAEGFRKITYYPDRPDVMARFKVRIESDLPILLSNGNPVGKGKGWAEWDDPWPKPSDLFALVAKGIGLGLRSRFVGAAFFNRFDDVRFGFIGFVDRGRGLLNLVFGLAVAGGRR